MYIKSISIENVRVVESTSVQFRYPGEGGLSRKLAYPNVTLLVGNNGAGKSTILRSVALAGIGPISAKAPVNDMVRRSVRTGSIKADFLFTWQDFGSFKLREQTKTAHQSIRLEREGERFESFHALDRGPDWKPLFDERSSALFLIGYGATRRSYTERESSKERSRAVDRWERIAGLFEESWAIEAIHEWLPGMRFRNKGRFTQVWRYLASLMPAGYSVDEKALVDGQVRIRHGEGGSVPLSAMSDGFKAYFGWVADVLKHICFLCPKSQKLEENRGLVMVDEIDLHLHPAWQSRIVPSLAMAFPKVQFIFTTHSPIVVGSVEKENVWVCENEGGSSTARQFDIGVHGLNADQILLTEYFGIGSSRAKEKVQQLQEIVSRAEQGDEGAADQFAKELVMSLEDSSETTRSGPLTAHAGARLRTKPKKRGK